MVDEPEDSLAKTAGSLVNEASDGNCASFSVGGVGNSSYICNTSSSSIIGLSEYTEGAELLLAGRELSGFLRVESLGCVRSVAQDSNI